MDEKNPIPAKRRGSFAPRTLLVSVALLAAVFAVSSCGAASGGGGQGSGTGGQSAPAKAPEKALAASRYALGEANAPVVMVEYGDYQ